MADRFDDLYAAAYDELRRLAEAARRRDAGATLQPTALVHEAYLRLARGQRLPPASRLHLRRLAARAMRHVLVDAARRRAALKRGGRAPLVTFEDDAMPGRAPTVDADELLALHDALGSLAQMNPRQAALVEARFFGGYDAAETADLLGVSEATVTRDWRAARAWLGAAVAAP